MTSLFPASPTGRRTEVQVFQVDQRSVIDGILNGSNHQAGGSRRKFPDALILSPGSGHSSPRISSGSNHSRTSPRSSRTKSSNKAKLVLSQEDKRRLLVGSDLVPKKNKTMGRSTVAQGIQHYFASKKNTT